MKKLFIVLIIVLSGVTIQASYNSNDPNLNCPDGAQADPYIGPDSQFQRKENQEPITPTRVVACSNEYRSNANLGSPTNPSSSTGNGASPKSGSSPGTDRN